MPKNIIKKFQYNDVEYEFPQGGGGGSVVNLTQAEYDALETKDPNTIYNITDAQDIDVYTKEETNTLLSTKQDTLVSGTNIKTINNESILGEGNINISGGGGATYNSGRNIYIDENNNINAYNVVYKIGTGTTPYDEINYNYRYDNGGAVEATLARFPRLKVNGERKSILIQSATGAYDIDLDSVYLREHQSLKTINGESIVGEGNITISGSGGAYLPLSGGTLTGHLVLGGGTETAFKKVEAIRQVNNVPNGAAFYVNSDGTAAFFHKTYSSTALAGAVNDAILRFNNEGLYFAKGATNRTSATDYKEVLTEETAYKKSEVYNKTEIDAMIGNINNILNSI